MKLKTCFADVLMFIVAKTKKNDTLKISNFSTDHLIACPISCYVTTSCNLFNISSFYFIFPNLKRSPIEKRHAKHRVTLLYLCVLLLARSSDIALNPGPDSSNFPCGYCHKEVTWSNIMSLMCDNCDQWFHVDCQGIGNTTFDILSH